MPNAPQVTEWIGHAGRVFWVLAVCLGLSSMPVPAQDTASPERDEGEIVFVPPATGAPADRLGAGTRDVGQGSGATLLLAPEGGGLSASAEPLLIWHFTERVDGPLALAITPVGGMARGVVLRIEGRFAPGFHGADLARSRFRLAPGQVYRWELSGPEKTASPSALIEYRPVERAPGSAAEAASAGYWYDALSAMFEVDFSGRVRVTNPAGLRSLATSAGVDLTKIPDARQ